MVLANGSSPWTTSLLRCSLRFLLLVDNDDHPSLSSPSSTGDDVAANRMMPAFPLSCISIMHPQNQQRRQQHIISILTTTTATTPITTMTIRVVMSTSTTTTMHYNKAMAVIAVILMMMLPSILFVPYLEKWYQYGSIYYCHFFVLVYCSCSSITTGRQQQFVTGSRNSRIHYNRYW